MKKDIMLRGQSPIKEFLDNAGFSERIIIGMLDNAKIYFHVDLSDELAKGLMRSAVIDKSIYIGIKELAANLNAILEGIEEYRQDDDEQFLSRTYNEKRIQ
jgi:hypothetical protein